MFHSRLSTAFLAILLLSMGAEVYAANKKDFRGLFGNYRREQYVENEGRDTDVGFDIQLSTMMPVSPFVKSIETTAGNAESLKYATFFNIDLGFFLTLNYHWELYAALGYYTYDTRKENANSSPTLPQFHEFEFSAFPVVGGVRYRFSTDDIVPYVGLGVGMAYVKRRAGYDYSAPTFHQQYITSIVGQAQMGVEFFIAARTGIRLEVAGYFMNLPAFEYRPGATVNSFPAIVYQANPWSVRYSSGLFMLF